MQKCLLEIKNPMKVWKEKNLNVKKIFKFKKVKLYNKRIMFLRIKQCLKDRLFNLQIFHLIMKILMQIKNKMKFLKNS